MCWIASPYLDWCPRKVLAWCYPHGLRPVGLFVRIFIDALDDAIH